MDDPILIKFQPGRWTSKDQRFCVRIDGTRYIVRDGKDNSVKFAITLKEAEAWVSQRIG